jgi:hypothetical protein
MKRMSNDDTVRVDLASQLCKALTDSGVLYGILHGAEDFPKSEGRDFDIIIRKSNLSSAVATVRSVASEAGWHSVQASIHWAGAPIIFWRSEPTVLHTFEFHFIPQLVWAGVALANPDTGDIRRDPKHGLPVAIKAGFAKRVLTQVLAGCWSRMNERIHELYIRDEEREASALCARALFGSQLGKQLILALTPPDLTLLRRLAPKMRLMAILRSLSPFHPARWAPVWYFGKISRWSGSVRWRLPNLIVLCTSIDTAVTLLDESLEHLGFSKPMVLEHEGPGRLQGRITERAKIRLHRGLFRFVAIAGTVSDKTAILARFPPTSVDGGNLVIEINFDESTIMAEMILGTGRAQVSQVVFQSKYAPSVAALFFRGVLATAEGIKRFKEN